MAPIDPTELSRTPLRRLITERAQGAARPYLLAVRDDRVVTYPDLVRRVDEVAGALAAAGLSAGDRVGLMIADPFEFVVTFLGVISAGLWVAPLDPSTPPSGHARLAERIAELSLAAVVGDVAPVGTGTWMTVPLAGPATSTEADGGGVVLSSSGTTGTPKVVALPTRQLLHTAALIAEHNGLTEADRGFNPLPLFHINAEVVAVLASLAAGASLCVDDRFHRTGFWDQVDRLGATWVNAVPAIVSRLVRLHPGEVVPSRLRFVRSASAPLPPATLEAFEATIGVPVIESYGMTEAASQICANPLDGVRKAGSVGRPIGVELRVVPVEGEGAGSDESGPEAGHVEIRGASIITAYESPGYEDRFDAEGWLRTGDLGYVDEDGYVFLAGRSDDVINRGGEKMFPREIEEVLLAVPGVRFAAVIGAPDEVFGQLPVSFVQLDDAENSGADDVRPRVKAIVDVLLESFTKERRPVSVAVVREMPTLATGKVHKPTLRRGDVDVIVVEPII